MQKGSSAQATPGLRTRTYVAVALLGLFSAFLAFVGWGANSGPPRRSLLMISLDTVRADHLSAYGYELDTSPFLRRLSSQGARLSQAYAASATTGPSHATIFTSLYPLAHGVLKNGLSLGGEHPTLAEILGRVGYDTVGIVSSFVLDARFGYARGFDRLDDDFDAETSSEKSKTWTGFDVTAGFDRRANDTTDRAVQWLEGRSADSPPFFLFVHYFDAHAPYDPPEPYRSRFAEGREAKKSPASECEALRCRDRFCRRRGSPPRRVAGPDGARREHLGGL